MQIRRTRNTSRERITRIRTENPHLRILIDRFCQLLAVDELMLVDGSRTQVLAEARFLLMHLIWSKWHIPKSYIAWFFAYDHTSVMHGIAKIDDWLEIDRHFRAYYDNINGLLDVPEEIQGFNLVMTSIPNPLEEVKLGRKNDRLQ